ncbi:kelch-like protein 24 [Branchiostoma lanceolatum]|uniref:kelch-like protein 24 n=1 Tax=Branchiostoma lanceolatum TaxID=7740 RepID=UPI003453EE50
MDVRSEEDCCADEFFCRLQGLRSEGHLVDVTLCAEGKEIRCHRLVLSACSDYFHAMFGGAHSESKKDKIEIGGVSAEALQLLVDFAYTPKFNITEENVYHQFEAANMLQVKPVEDACEKFLTNNLSPDTCLEVWTLADNLSFVKLSAVARRYALKSFAEVCKTEEFLQLPIEFLKTYISDQGLHAKKEAEVLDAVMLWARHDFKQRKSHLKELLECVCFSGVDRDYLKNMMETDKVLSGVPGIKELIKDPSRHGKPRHFQQEEIVLLGGIMSGYDPPIVNQDVYRLNLDFDVVDKAPLTQIFQFKEGSAACVLDNDVIVTGGDKSMSQAWRYKPSLNSWTRLKSLKKGRKHHGMAVLNGDVYVVGGENRACDLITDVEVYSGKTNRWTKVAPLIYPVIHFGIATCCDKVFGGQMEHYCYRLSDEVQFYDSTRKEWDYATALPYALADIKACTINSKIYLVGGDLDRVLCYNPQEEHYEEMAKRLCRWNNCSATVSGSEIYITGGWARVIWNMNINPFSTVQCYDVSSDTMIMCKDLPLPLCEHHTVTVSKH